jgi:adenylate kinase
MTKTKTLGSNRDVCHLESLNTASTPGPLGIVFLGSPGAGKGTQARHVASDYNLAHISTGDVFRTHVAKQTALGLQAAECMSRGMLVPDQVVCGMLAEHVQNLSSADCLILDGFPRSVAQAKWLDRFLQMRSGETYDPFCNAPLAIQINMQRDHLLRRLVGRRSCPRCGRTYNLHLLPPRNSGICDYDSAELVVRSDDSESVVCERLMIHDQNTFPLTEYYRHKGRLLEFDGNDTVEAVRTAIAIELESVFGSETT